MRSLVATRAIAAKTRVAAYPIEVVPDDDDHDDTYAVGIFQEINDPNPKRRSSSSSSSSDVGRREVDNVSGVPTAKSLARAYVEGLPTVGMFANEPDANSPPNCALVFPLARASDRVELGNVLCAYLETIRPVRKGEALTWCYGDSYVDRGYATSCSDAAAL